MPELTPAPPPASAPARWLAAYLALCERRWFRWSRDLAVLAALLVGIGAWQARGHVRGLPPEVPLAFRDGTPASLATLRGKPAMVVFWAPWCGVCGAQSDNVGRVMGLLGGRASVVSVATAFEDPREVDAYVAKHQVAYPVLLGGEDAARAFRVAAFPTIYFLDAEGRIRGSAAGYTTTAGMVARLLLP